MENIKEQIKELTENLENRVKELFNSQNYKDYLKTMSKFHRYSFRNLMLIVMQKPDAQQIAGFTTWKNQFKRYVNKGENGIKILAPAPYKKVIEAYQTDAQGNYVLDEVGKKQLVEKEITVPAYKITYVFDVSQTSGEPLPEPFHIATLTGNVQQYEYFINALEQTSPVPVLYEHMNDNMDGYYSRNKNHIAIRANMSEIQTLAALVHEITHAILHSGEVDKNRNTEEVEAESVAFVVCQHFGIDTSDNSFGYIATWSSGKDLEELQKSLDLIQKTAAEIITSVEERFHELNHEKEQPEKAPLKDRIEAATKKLAENQERPLPKGKIKEMER